MSCSPTWRARGASSGLVDQASSRRWPGRSRRARARCPPRRPARADATPGGISSDSATARNIVPRSTAAGKSPGVGGEPAPCSQFLSAAPGRRRSHVEGLAQAVDGGVVVPAAPALDRRGPAPGARDEQDHAEHRQHEHEQQQEEGGAVLLHSTGLPLRACARPRRPAEDGRARPRPAAAGARRSRAAAGSGGSGPSPCGRARSDRSRSAPRCRAGSLTALGGDTAISEIRRAPSGEAVDLHDHVDRRVDLVAQRLERDVQIAHRRQRLRAGGSRRRRSWRARSPGEPSWPVLSACSMSSVSPPRTSPTMIRSGRMRSELRTRSRIEISPRPSTLGGRPRASPRAAAGAAARRCLRW